MTTGIYLLTFKKPVWGWYIGKSVDIENRYSQHILSLTSGTHTKKLQDAFYKCKKPPELKILAECHKDWLDILEHDLFKAAASYYSRAKRPPYFVCLNTLHLESTVHINNKKKYIRLLDFSEVLTQNKPIKMGLLDLT